MEKLNYMPDNVLLNFLIKLKSSQIKNLKFYVQRLMFFN